MKKNHFDFSIITNIQNDHIDFHGNYENYKNAKLKICSEMGKTIFCGTDDYREFAIAFVSGIEPKLNVEDLNLSDLPFRLQKISPGIINDSKSTNSASLLYAINKLNFKGDLIICGNPNKENCKELCIEGPRRVFIFGKHQNELLNILKHKNISTFENLDEIFNILKKDKHRDILFSPGNPSGNDYSNFIERGQHFNNLKESILINRKENLFDLTLLVPFLIITGISLIFIYSSSNVIADADFGNPFFFLQRQIIALSISLVACSIFFLFQYLFIRKTDLFCLF